MAAMGDRNLVSINNNLFIIGHEEDICLPSGHDSGN
jgi:hypothetical protein